MWKMWKTVVRRHYSTGQSFYMRPLNPPAVKLESKKGQTLLLEAIADGTAQKAMNQLGNYGRQTHPNFCGPASLSCVLNAMKVDPKQILMGPWRWFEDQMVADPDTMEKIRKEGTTFDEFATIASKHVYVDAYKASQSSLEHFTGQLRKISSSLDSYMIASYSRKRVNQTGSGHFSPIAAYHSQEDMALILDVACFKYDIHWLPGKLLWEAMNEVDAITGKTRGFFILRKMLEESATTRSWLRVALTGLNSPSVYPEKLV